MYAIFNKKTKEFIGWSPNEGATTGNVLYRKVTDKLDIGLYIWKGDYDTGEVVLKASTEAVIDEYKQEKKLEQKILKKYSVLDQLKVIIDQLDMVIEEDIKTSDFVALKKGLTALHKKHDKRMKHFKESENHSYISKEEVDRKFNKAFEV
jgi:hypothetical protein